MAEQPSDIEIDTMTEMIEQPSDNQTSETKMAEQSSDNKIGEATGMIGPPSDDQIEEHSPEDIITDVRFEFALKCLKTVMHLNKNKNIVFSPYSIYKGLLLVCLASSNDTESHLRCKLGLPDQIHQNYITEWITRTRKEKKKLPNYIDENSCWIANTKCAYKYFTHNLFRDELEVVDFHHAYNNLRIQINKLMREKTINYMRKPVELNNINEKMEIILSTVLSLGGNRVQRHDPTYKHEKKPKTILAHNLEMFVSELPISDKNLSLFLLIPAVKPVNCTEWIIDDKISELIERLTTKEGTDELRRVLDYHKSSRTKLNPYKMMYPSCFELENELEIDKLLHELGIQNLLEPDKATLSNFTDQNLHLGGAKHRAYIKVTQETITASTVNMFFTKEKGSFNLTEDINYSACTKKFLWLLYCKQSHTIHFMGSINEEKPLSPSKERKKSLVSNVRQMFS